MRIRFEMYRTYSLEATKQQQQKNFVVQTG